MVRHKAAMAYKTRSVLIIWTIVWIVMVLSGTLVLNSYSSTQGSSGQPPVQWPANSTIRPAAECSTLLMFIHPRCPCSRSSLRELARILALTNDCIETHVVFFRPTTEPTDWSHTDLVQTAVGIPGVEVVADENAVSASEFAVETSGHVLLYSREGLLLFSGGITAGRGHDGESGGRSAVESLILGKSQLSSSYPVFGCPILDSKDLSILGGNHVGSH